MLPVRKHPDSKSEFELRNLEADKSWFEYQRTGLFIGDEEISAWLKTWGTDEETSFVSGTVWKNAKSLDRR